MAALSVQNAALTGTAISFASASGGGDTIANDTGVVLIVKNGGGGSINATITRQVTSKPIQGEGNVTLSDVVIAVAAGATTIIGQFPQSCITTAGLVAISYSSVTSVTVAAVKVNEIR